MKSSVINSTLFGLWKEQLQNGSQVLLLKMALVPLVILGKQEFNMEGCRALVPLGVCALLHSETREHAHAHTHRVPFAPKQGSAYTGTCSCTNIFVRRDMHVLTQCL